MKEDVTRCGGCGIQFQGIDAQSSLKEHIDTFMAINDQTSWHYPSSVVGPTAWDRSIFASTWDPHSNASTFEAYRANYGSIKPS
jgi:hypothetical protein